MKKLITTALLAGVMLVGCGDSQSDRGLQQTWDTILDDESRAALCEGYADMPRDDSIELLTSEPDAMTTAEAEALLDLLEEEC